MFFIFDLLIEPFSHYHFLMSAFHRSGLFSLPNLLTYGRIVAVPVVVGLLFYSNEDWARWVALAVYALAAITDFFDGYLARRLDQFSPLGQMLDPIADKLLIASCLLMLAADGTIAGWSLWAAIIILCREILVSGLREHLAGMQVSVPVSQLAKWKTVVQILAVGFLIAGPAGEVVLPHNTLIGITLLWISAVITLLTGYDYCRKVGRHF